MKNNIFTALALTSLASLAFGNAWADTNADADSRFREGNGESNYLASQLKQNAYFEATQVVGRFFLCIPEAANQKDKRDTLANIEKCFEETTDANIINDIGGSLSYGRGATLNIATRVLAPLRKDVTF